MSLVLLELAAATLSDLLPEVVFVGGATVILRITDPGAPPVRPTKDVDVIVEVTTRGAFHNFEARLRERGFAEDQEDGDFLGSRDFGDIIAMVDGREEFVEEVATAPDDVRRYLAEEIDALLAVPRFLDGLFGALRADQISQSRAETIVLPALRAISSAR